ncbi:hypothetical protein [Hyunsoonleella rubra]|uniref:DUF3552 domain-containing protein n=1 Tax=Hyunsoonleella rubra TaxID=1737062 RepID=A0ABW5T8V7_9FLAO
MNGYITLGIIALLFVAMYVYSYGTVYMETLKEKRDKRKLHEHKEAMLRLKMRKQRQREEKYQKIYNRSQEIQKRIKEVERDRVLITQKLKDNVALELMKNKLQGATQQQTG